MKWKVKLINLQKQIYVTQQVVKDKSPYMRNAGSPFDYIYIYIHQAASTQVLSITHTKAIDKSYDFFGIRFVCALIGKILQLPSTDGFSHTGLISNSILSPDVPRVSWTSRPTMLSRCQRQNQPEPMRGRYHAPPRYDVAGLLFEWKVARGCRMKARKRENENKTTKGMENN